MSTAIVIFGASGDLTGRKLIPALYSNFRKNRLPGGTRIYGFSRSPLTVEGFRQKMKEGVQEIAGGEFDAARWGEFAALLDYHSGDVENEGDYAGLKSRIQVNGESPEQCLYYLAIAPPFFPRVLAGLESADMIRESSPTEERRIVFEKPFGRDLDSARALNQELRKSVREEQIYRIDHYLGKETVQNVLMLRFGNAIFEPLWNRNYIDHVQITVSETVGVEHRAGYYDATGALRDMFQNHLLQLLTLVAMEPPAKVEANALRNEKVKVLDALRDIPPEYASRYTVRGQYRGYLAEEGVDPASGTETFAALQLYVDNWRWQGVPFYLRSGKKMKEKRSEIVIQFRRPPTQIFDVQAGATELFTNRLSVCIQPDEGMHLRFIAKVPDRGMSTAPVDMDFHYRDAFPGQDFPEAYERLLLDALHGDASLFARSDEIELAWKLIDGVRAGWEGDRAPSLEIYEPGSWGPESSERLAGREGRWWMHDCGRTEESGGRVADGETS
jgi:glucose-6-phosphate 1-dehydrogenase